MEPALLRLHLLPGHLPTTLAQLRQIKSELPPEAVDKLQIVLVSVDPNRDTPKQLKQYLGYFDPQFIGLPPHRSKTCRHSPTR